MQLKLHLVFQPGTCEKAFNLYKEAMRGEIVFLLTKSQDPDTQASEHEKNHISHMVLKTKHFEIGGHDAFECEELCVGNNAKQVLVFADRSELDRTFELLAEGGQITMPIQKVSFSEAFGEVVDKFGITWIIMMTEKMHSA